MSNTDDPVAGVHRCFVHRSFTEHFRGCPPCEIPSVYDAPDGYSVRVIQHAPVVLGEWQVVLVDVSKIPSLD